MKIAFVVHTAYPEHIGGREHHIHHLANAVSAWAEVVVLCGGAQRQVVPDARYRLVVLPAIAWLISTNPLQWYRIIFGLSARLQQERPDIVHAFEYGSHSTHVAAGYAQRRRIPFVMTAYGYRVQCIAGRFLKLFYDYVVGRKLLQRSQLVICPSRTQREEIMQLGRGVLSGPCLIQPHGIPVAQFTPISRATSRVQEMAAGEIKILVIARLLPRKGLRYLIEALKLLGGQEAGQSMHLYIAGPDCGERAVLERQVRISGVSNAVTFLGAVPYSRVVAFYASADIFVLPSLYEGFPLVLLEAMASGVAVVASDLPGTRHLIRHHNNGLLVAPGCAQALADALLILAKDEKLRRRLGEHARTGVVAYNSHDEAAMLRVQYERLLSAPVPRRKEERYEEISSCS